MIYGAIMATTLDFTIDTHDDISQLATPGDAKRKRHEMKTPPDQVEDTINQVTIVLNPRRSIVQITSPEAKKLRNLSKLNLDPDIEQLDPKTLDLTPIIHTAQLAGSEGELIDSQDSPTNTLPDNDIIPAGTQLIDTKGGLVNNNTLHEDSQMEVSIESSCLIDTQDSPTNTQPGNDITAAGTNAMPSRPIHARPRSYSDPSVNLENSSISLDNSSSSPDKSKDLEQSLKPILLDIQARMSKIETREVLTETQMRKIMVEMNRPIIDKLSQVNATVQKHEEIIYGLENKHLAMENKLSIVRDEISKHINITSAEYAELKTCHNDNVSTLKDEVSAVSTQQEKEVSSLTSQMNEITRRIAEIDSRLKNQRNEQEEFLQNMKRTPMLDPLQQQDNSADSQRIRTHQDDIMRRSIILEGVPEARDEYLMNVILNLGEELEITLRPCEVSQIRRVGIFKRSLRKPRPVRVTFVGEIKRDIFLQRKKNLMHSDLYHTCMIHPDETPATRQFKAHLKYAAEQARRQNAYIWQRHNAISINGKRYDAKNQTELENDYPWPTSTKPQKRDLKPNIDRPKTLEELRAEKSKPPQTGIARSNETTRGQNLSPKEANELIGSLGSHRSVKITPYGLAFYTGECVLSNHFKTEFTYNGRIQSSSEQAYFAEMAIVAKDPEALKDIMNTDLPSEAKLRSEKIVPGPNWPHLKRPRMRSINYAKFSQSPMLKKKLLSTRGMRLIEASPNSEWGCGVHLNSKNLMSGQWMGKNYLGEELEDVREDLHRTDQSAHLTDQTAELLL